MTSLRFGLILRIALLVVGIEVAAFSLLGWFYVDRFTAAAEDRIRSRLLLVGQMIGRNELAVSAVAVPQLMSNMVGAPYVGGLVIGGSGRVIVSSDPVLLGVDAADVPGIDPAWLAETGPLARIIAGAGTLTGVSRIQNAGQGSFIYVVVTTIGTSELEAQKETIAWWGRAVAAVFVLLTSAGLILVAHRLITRRVDASLAVLKDVENGALGARIPVWSHDELGQLQAAINSMTAKLGALLMQHRRNEEEMSTLLDAIGDGVVAVGPEGEVTRFNPGAAAILGAAPALRRPVADLLPELALPDGWWRSAASLTESGRLAFERRMGDGGVRPIELGHGPIQDPDGTVEGAVLVLQDVTARRLAENELREAIERLTVSNSELERFAYVASHDLQEPLRTIISFTQLLERHIGSTLEAEDRENFDFVIDAAKRMSLLINDLLAYSRVNTRGIQFAPLALGDACASALRNLHDTIAASQAEVVVGDLPKILGDSSQMMQVFQNLIGNAIKFSRAGVPPRVEVSCRRQDQGWMVSVADNGIGIEDTDQDIFEVFRRLHAVSSFPGSGVGLAICKRIIMRHGGRIWYDSRPGQGTCFHFTLPAAEAGGKPAPSDPAGAERPESLARN